MNVVRNIVPLRALSLSLSLLIRTLMLHTGVESARHQTGEPLHTLLFQEEEYGATTLPENGEERAQKQQYTGELAG